jgi:hypothetical protein
MGERWKKHKESLMTNDLASNSARAALRAALAAGAFVFAVKNIEGKILYTDGAEVLSDLLDAAENERLRAALQRYGQHDTIPTPCARMKLVAGHWVEVSGAVAADGSTYEHYECTCGLSAVLDELGTVLIDVNNLRAENERLRAWQAALQPWDGSPPAATDTVWIEPGRKPNE